MRTHDDIIYLPIFSQLQDEVARRNTANLPVVMTAHLYIKNSDITGHDERQMVGGIESESLDAFGTNYDYLISSPKPVFER